MIKLEYPGRKGVINLLILFIFLIAVATWRNRNTSIILSTLCSFPYVCIYIECPCVPFCLLYWAGTLPCERKRKPSFYLLFQTKQSVRNITQTERQTDIGLKREIKKEIEMEEEKKATAAVITSVKSSRFKRVCVFCGSSAGKKICYKDAALDLGKELVLPTYHLATSSDNLF